jgi:hypothetical protein
MRRRRRRWRRRKILIYEFANGVSLRTVGRCN